MIELIKTKENNNNITKNVLKKLIIVSYQKFIPNEL